MKRFRRWLFNGLAPLSLLLCVVTVALWVRSYMTADATWFQTPGACAGHLISSHGDFILAFGRETEIYSGWWKPGVFAHSFPSVGPSFTYNVGRQDGGSIYSRLGLIRAMTELPQATNDPNLQKFLTTTSTFRCIFVPHWLLLAAFVYVPTRWVWDFCRNYNPRRNRGDGLCIRCGYDLRATPDRCPECGTVPSKAKISN
jgi:hypothetical protein